MIFQLYYVRMAQLGFIGFVICGLLSATTFAQADVKFIATGWDHMTPAVLLEQTERLQNLPFDERFKLAGQIVRRGQLAGIIFDPEPYYLPKVQLMANQQGTNNPQSWEEFQKIARLRGHQTMKAFAAEAPNAKILCYYWLSKVSGGVDPEGNTVTTRNQWYELLPSFADGWYAELADGMNQKT